MKNTICLLLFLLSLVGCELEPVPPTDTLLDDRDGQTYAIVKIGDQIWMADNLNYAGENGNVGYCYDSIPANCEKYGRLYDWETAMNGANESSNVPSGVQGICPEGWHIPSKDEFQVLLNFLGGDGIAGAKLKAPDENVWPTTANVDNGENSNFMALPSGCYNCTSILPGYRFIGGMVNPATGFLTSSKLSFLGTTCSDLTLAVAIDLVDMEKKAQVAPICPTDKRLSCRCIMD